LCNINSSKLSEEIKCTADRGAGFSNFTALVFTGASIGSTIVNALDRAVNPHIWNTQIFSSNPFVHHN
jgi:hypothetical protein